MQCEVRVVRRRSGGYATLLRLAAVMLVDSVDGIKYVFRCDKVGHEAWRIRIPMAPIIYECVVVRTNESDACVTAALFFGVVPSYVEKTRLGPDAELIANAMVASYC